MEISIYGHEIEYCGVTPMDECGVILDTKDIKHICKTFSILHYIEEWDYNPETDTIILYISPIP